MNIAQSFEGTGMRMMSSDEFDRDIEAEKAAIIAEQETNANAVEAALAQPAANTDRGIFERSLAVRRAEKAKQQAITAASVAKTKQLTISIRAIEDALDGILASEG